MEREIMPQLQWEDGNLVLEGMHLKDIAEKVGTPLFVYSKQHIVQQYQSFYNAFAEHKPLIAYAFKANFNLEILRLLASLGCGADVVSGGELFLALLAGISPEKIVFNGNGKTREEIDFALEHNILMFNVDNLAEAEIINELAGKKSEKARIAFRVNPDIDPKTHPYISTGLQNSKFGIPIEDAIDYYEKVAKLPNIEVVGVHAHLGSQLTSLDPLVESAEKIGQLIVTLRKRGIDIKYYDLGGGIGIRYKDEIPPTPAEYEKRIGTIIKEIDVVPIFEPGRYIVGNAGILLCQVLYIKQGRSKNFVVVDAGMNDLIRPAFYEAYHHIIPLEKKTGSTIVADVVGPICESGDFLGKDRELVGVDRDDYLAILSAGAYGFSMSSNYNARLKPAEVLVDGNAYTIIRRRQSFDSLVRCP